MVLLFLQFFFYVSQGRKPSLVVAQTPVLSFTKCFRNEATIREGQELSLPLRCPSLRFSEGRTLFCQ